MIILRHCIFDTTDYLPGVYPDIRFWIKGERSYVYLQVLSYVTSVFYDLRSNVMASYHRKCRKSTIMTKSTKRYIFSHNWHEFMYKKVINLDVWEENKYSMDNI